MNNKRVCNIAAINLNEQLQRFWNIEESPIQLRENSYTPQEQLAEDLFLHTVRRDQDGRYIVRMPRDESIKLDDSENIAIKRFLAIERKLNQQSKLKADYHKFVKEYEELGHMSIVQQPCSMPEKEYYYLPHQPVIKTTSITTKLRVVFDGSSKSSTGTSLNQKLLSGANLQRDLWEIMIRFRAHQYVMTADIKMMFRQIWIAEEDRDLQRIIWRYDSTEPIQVYSLNTVTYGTTCAPFLAMRCLRHLATQSEAMTRKTAAALLQDFHMDDVLTDSHTLKQAIKLRSELSELLEAAGFPLRKWRASDTRILQGLSQEIEEDSLLVLDDAVPSKTLGLLWDSSKDQLQYSISLTDSNQNTKRSILSQIARIYDPLGLIGPVLIVAKIIMQNLWKLDVGWDDPVSPAFYEIWFNYYTSLEALNQIRISRNFNPQNSKQSFTLHGFGDASEKAYDASIYCVYESKQGERKSYLVCSKAKVAPLKTISLSKLELCAALILARLLAAVIKAMKHPIKDVHLWSDSTIVLCWLDTLPHKLKSYYANRVIEIHELVPEAKWHHVPSTQNPADILSRGSTVNQLKSSSLWWNGPTWLTHEDQWPKTTANVPMANLELREENVFVATEPRQDILQRYSSFNKLKRIIAYCLRFRDILSSQRHFNALNPEELKRAELIISRMVQAERFPRESCSLQQGKEVPANSQLAALNPFLDEEGVIRVGGRLKHADIPYNQRHPIVLPARHHITEILLRQEHIKLHHCGSQQLLADIRTRYWPLSGRREARKIVRRCISCFR